MNENQSTIITGNDANPTDNGSDTILATQDIDVTNTQLSNALVDIDTPTEWVSYPIQSRNDELRIAAMRSYIGNDIKRLKQEQGWEVANLYLTSQEYAARTGEIISGPVLHLINPLGKSLRITAKYAILAILTFVKSWKPFPWNPPVRIRAKDTILDSGNRVYEIEFLE